MALTSCGTTVSFNGTQITQPTSVKSSGLTCTLVEAGVTSKGIKMFEGGNIDLGDVTVETYTADISRTEVSKNGSLVIGGQAGFTVDAVFQSLDVSISVGEPIKFVYKFKLTGTA